MQGGRLRIVNDSRYPDEEVMSLVRFGLEEIDVKGHGLLAIVKNTKRPPRWSARAHEADPARRIPAYSGTAYDLYEGIPVAHAERMTRRERFLVVVRVGPPERFPIKPYRRNGSLHDYRSWEEALVGITAHEGRHIQHYYDGSYEHASGWRRPATVEIGGKKVPYRRGGLVRVGHERIEPKCDAFEIGTLARYRRTLELAHDVV